MLRYFYFEVLRSQLYKNMDTKNKKLTNVPFSSHFAERTKRKGKKSFRGSEKLLRKDSEKSSYKESVGNKTS